MSLITILTLLSCSKDDFRWNLISLPELSETIISGNSLSSLKVESNLISNGNDENTVKGFCWSANNDPDLDDFKYVIQNSKEETFTHTIPWSFTGIIYVRSFAINKLDTVYSEVVSTIWTGDADNMPLIQTNSVTQIEFYKANINCQLISNGNLTVVEKGIYLSESSQPTESNSIKITDNSGSLSFSVSALNLDENTTYYVRAFAKNFAFTGLGNVLSFTTKKYYNVGEVGPSGGIIFYSKLDTIGGWNFLEAAPQDYTNLLVWSPNNNSINGTATNLGTGVFNSQLIIGSFGSSQYAAFNSSTYVSSGFNDWYLPSRDELIKLRQNLYLTGNSNLVPNSQYWSSSQDDFYTQNAWSVKMSINGETTTSPKSSLFKARFIRQF